MNIYYMIGVFFGGLVAGSLTGLIPFLIGLKKEETTLGIIAIITCSLSGLILGILLAIPVAIGFIVAILIKAKNSEMKCPHCAENIKKNAVICKHCKQPLQIYK